MRRTVAVVAAVVASLVGGACGPAPQERAERIREEDVPFDLLDAGPPLTTTTPPRPRDPVALCFATARGLTIVEITLDAPVDPEDTIAALAEPVLVPDAPRPTFTRSAISDPSIVRSVNVVSGIAHVDLAPTILSLGGDQQLLAIAQIVCTLTGRPGIGQVLFTMEGNPIDVPRGDGVLASTPLSRDDYADLLSR